MTVASETRRWSYYTSYRPVQRHVAGVHAKGGYKPFCTRCGSPTHMRVECHAKLED